MMKSHFVVRSNKIKLHFIFSHAIVNIATQDNSRTGCKHEQTQNDFNTKLMEIKKGDGNAAKLLLNQTLAQPPPLLHSVIDSWPDKQRCQELRRADAPWLVGFYN